MALLFFSTPCLAQTKASNRISKSKPRLVKKSSPDPYVDAREAVRALKTMQAVVEIGGSYANYTSRLADVKVIVDERLKLIPEDDDKSINRPKQDIQQALNSYVSAASTWEQLIKSQYPELRGVNKKLLAIEWESAASYLRMAEKALDRLNKTNKEPAPQSPPK